MVFIIVMSTYYCCGNYGSSDNTNATSITTVATIITAMPSLPYLKLRKAPYRKASKLQ